MASNESLTDLTVSVASEEERAHSNLMMIIATLTWVLLSIITLFIYCCNYWQVLRSRPHRHQRESESEVQQNTLLSLDN
ncbi:uncharacterized protein LOC113565065 [Drosophila persimilis]|uniref:uncharacterized protein LOC113565065 n=1 Tax=Drosophila persimilis TaxID=7234 RepID=UPI000F076C1D|nr:uncharacterized protein LOC113565065 [Drosophila persimilis]